MSQQLQQQTLGFVLVQQFTVRFNAQLVTAGAITHFTFSSSTLYLAPTAGTVITQTITAFDASNALATGYAGTVHFTSTDAQATLPADHRLLTSALAGVGFFGYTTAVYGSGGNPSDGGGAVGPSSFIDAVNDITNINATFIYSKTGVRQNTGTPANSMPWGNDTHVIYNEIDQKFFIAAISTYGSGSNILAYARSLNSNPTTFTTSDWTIGSVATSADYPKVGYNADGYFISGNNVLDVAVKYDGTVYSYARQSPPTAAGAVGWPVVAPNADPSDPIWVLFPGNDGVHYQIILEKITNPFSSSPTYTYYTLTTSVLAGFVDASQPSGVIPTSGDSSVPSYGMLRDVGSKSRLVCAAFSLKSADVAKTVSAGWWFEIDLSDPSAPVLLQQGEINPGTAISVFLLAVAINQLGDIGVAYMQSSASQFPAMYVAGRKSYTPTNLVGDASLVFQSSFNWGSTRLGDFTNISVDPTDYSFWSSGKGNDSGAGNQWDSWIQNWSVQFSEVVSFTLKTAAATQTVTASDLLTSSITGVSQSFNVVAATTTNFTISVPASARGGVHFGVTVSARDAFNNLNTTYAGTVHMSSVTDGAATFGINATLSSGVGIFSVTLFTTGTQTVAATDTVTVTITGTSAGVPTLPWLLARSSAGSTPTGVGFGCFFTPDGAFAILCNRTNPKFFAWPWTYASGFGTIVTAASAPNTIGIAAGAAMTHDGTVVVICGFASGGRTVAALPFVNGAWGTQFADPGFSLSGNGNCTAFNPTDTVCFFGMTTTPFALACHFTSGASGSFGAAYSAPSALPGAPATEGGIAVHPGGTCVAFACGTNSPFCDVRSWNDSTGWGSTLGSLPTLPSAALAVAFNPAGTVIMFAHGTSPRLRAFQFSASTGIGTQYTDPTVAIAGAPTRIQWSPDGTKVYISHSSSPFISAYEWNDTTGFGSRLTDPATLPGGNGDFVAVSPDGLSILHANALTTESLKGYVVQ